jgi:hypothetical protein
VEDLFAMINEKDLEKSDKEYVNEMTSGIISDITKAIDESDTRKKDTRSRIEMTDTLRWIMVIDVFGDIRIAYMGLQDVLNWEQLDARNTASTQADFHDLVVAKVNDESWVPETMAIPEDLLSSFAEPISCPKREYYNLTRERSNTLLLEFNHKLNEICKRYNQSGDGSGQFDSDGIEVERTDERDFGRVNLEFLAKQKGGDDRQAFLPHEPVDLLYFWDVMDHHDLIHFSTAQLRGSNVVSSDESRPALISYNASDSDSSGPRPRKKSRNGIDGDDVAQKMNDNMSKVGDAMIEMNKQSMPFEINALKRDLQQLKNEWRKEKKPLFVQIRQRWRILQVIH